MLNSRKETTKKNSHTHICMNGRAMNPARIECNEEKGERKKISEKFTQILVPRSRE